MGSGEIVLLISLLLVTGIAIAGLILLRKQGDSASEDERFYNANSDTLSLKGLIRKLKSEQGQYDIVAMEVSYGEISDDEEFVKKVDAFAKTIVKTVKGEFPDNYVGHQGYNAFWIAVPHGDPNSIDRKMQNIRNVIIAMNVKFNRIGVCYGYCCDMGSPVKKIEDANFAVKYAKRNGLVSAYFDDKVRQLKEDILKVVADPALIEKEFDVVYQPILSADTGLVAGAEAKVVWNDASGSQKYTIEEFYEEFVSRDVADKVDLFVLQNVSKILEYIKTKNKNVVVSMNVALSNLLDQEFVLEFKKIVERANFVKSNLLIGISDDLDLKDMSMIEKIKNNLRTLGLQAELKDFAAKENVYNQLSSDLFYRYKLSTVYTQDQLRQESEKVILFNMIDMVVGVKKSVVVDGVESAYVVKFIRDNTDGTLIQGGFLIKDVSRGRFEELITSETPVACQDIFSTEKIWGRPFRRRLNSPPIKDQRPKDIEIKDEPIVEDKKVEEVVEDKKVEVVEEKEEPKVEEKVEEPIKEEPKPEPVVEEAPIQNTVVEEQPVAPAQVVEPEPVVEEVKPQPQPEPQVIERIVYKTIEKEPEPVKEEPVTRVEYVNQPSFDLNDVKDIIRSELQQFNPVIVNQKEEQRVVDNRPSFDLNDVKDVIRAELEKANANKEQSEKKDPALDADDVMAMIKAELEKANAKKEEKPEQKKEPAIEMDDVKAMIQAELEKAKKEAEKPEPVKEQTLEADDVKAIVQAELEKAKKEEPKPEPVKEEKKPAPVAKVEEEDDEEEDDGDDEEVDVNEDSEREEERFAKLMAMFQKQFRDQWEAEMLKKYPELLKKHNERKQFAERIIGLSPENKSFFNTLKNSIMSYDGVTNATRKFYDTFIFDRKIIFKITVVGKSLKVYLALDPAKYPKGQFPRKDVSNIKKHEKTPFCVKVTSALSIKRVGILIEDLAQINGMNKNANHETKDYAKGMQFQIKRKK